MRKLAVLSALLVIFFSSHAHATGCTEQASTLTETAEKEWEKAKNNVQDMMPEPEEYSEQVKNCIGSLGNWVTTIGFKMPSIDEILRKLCDEIRSHIELPDLDFRINEQFGIGSQTLFEVGHREEAEDVFAQIWQEVWGD